MSLTTRIRELAFGNAPLAKVIPNAQDLLQDPARYLTKTKICFRAPLRLYASSIIVVLIGAWIGWDQFCTWEAAAIGAGIGAILSFRILFYTAARLTIQADGLYLSTQTASVRCPWQLFNFAGKPFVHLHDRIIVLPIHADAIPEVELLRFGNIAANGTQAKIRSIKITSENTIQLRAWFGVNLEELGDLILSIARQMNSRHSVRRPAAQPINQMPMIDHKGWLVTSLLTIGFPAECCDCGVPTVNTFNIPAVAKFADKLKGMESVVSIPICPKCVAGYRRYRLRKNLFCAFIGLLFGATFAFLVSSDLLGKCFVLIFFPMIGLAFGRFLGNWACVPVKIRKYDHAQKTARLHFGRDGYALKTKRVIERIQTGESPDGIVQPVVYCDALH